MSDQETPGQRLRRAAWDTVRETLGEIEAWDDGDWERCAAAARDPGSVAVRVDDLAVLVAEFVALAVAHYLDEDGWADEEDAVAWFLGPAKRAAFDRLRVALAGEAGT